MKDTQVRALARAGMCRVRSAEGAEGAGEGPQTWRLEEKLFPGQSLGRENLACSPGQAASPDQPSTSLCNGQPASASEIAWHWTGTRGPVRLPAAVRLLPPCGDSEDRAAASSTWTPSGPRGHASSLLHTEDLCYGGIALFPGHPGFSPLKHVHFPAAVLPGWNPRETEPVPSGPEPTHACVWGDPSVQADDPRDQRAHACLKWALP